MSRKRKPVKLPNSYGSVLKMSNANRRRRPYMVRVTTGYETSPSGKTIQKRGIIGYAETREEGLQMLAKYHEKPYDLSRGNPTFREIYQDWSDEKFQEYTTSSINGYRAAYNSCTLIFEVPFRDLRVQDLQKVIDTCGKNYPTLKNIRILFNQLYGYAIKNNICSTNYSKYVDISKFKDRNPNKYDREPFSKEQINVLWAQKEDPYIQMILILTYTGVRVGELLELKKENVHLKEQYFDVVSSKTESGIRKVPIGTMILPMFKEWYESSKGPFVFHTKEGEHFLYRNYYDSYFNPFMERFGYDQTPHCCRHTCISLLAEAKVSPTYQKLIVGHKGAMSITESVYTHIDMKELVKAIDSMYYPENILKELRKAKDRPLKRRKEYER